MALTKANARKTVTYGRALASALRWGSTHFSSHSRFEWDTLEELKRVYPDTWAKKLTKQPWFAGHWFKCRDCAQWFSAGYAYYLDDDNMREGNQYCHDCYSHWKHCAGCGLVFNIVMDIGAVSSGSRWYHKTCWEQRFAPCSECGRNSEKSTLVGGLCKPCRETANLFGHNANVLDQREGFLGLATEKLDRKKTLFLGVELELISKTPMRKTAVNVARNREWVIVKSDGSLRQKDERGNAIEMGFEINSIPATLAWHQAHWPQYLSELQKVAKGWDEKTCGMHVHMNASALSKLAQARLLVFANKGINREFMNRVAGRAPTQYCKVSDKKFTDAWRPMRHYAPVWDEMRNRYVTDANGSRIVRPAGPIELSSPMSRDSDGTGRYQAVNFATRGRGTIEIRIFQSNLAIAGFLKNVEFCDALGSFCQYGASNLSLDYLTFVPWVIERRSIYPNLAQWFGKRGYWDDTHRYGTFDKATGFQSTKTTEEL